MRPPNACTAEDLLVWPQWEKTCLTLERLEAPGSGEAWWVGVRGKQSGEEEWDEELWEGAVM